MSEEKNDDDGRGRGGSQREVSTWRLFDLELTWSVLEIVGFGVSMACLRDSCGLPWSLVWSQRDLPWR